MYSFRHLADINRDDDDGFGDESHERERLIFSLSTSMKLFEPFENTKISTINRFSSTRIMLHETSGPVMPSIHPRYNKLGFEIFFTPRKYVIPFG